jgi:hypothetical protein
MSFVAKIGSKLTAKRLLIFVMCFVSLYAPSADALSPEQRRLFDSGVLYYDLEVNAICSELGIVNGSIDRFLQVLAYQESSGNPTADARPASSASGKYQYIDSTWRARSSVYGPVAQYSRAKDAPETVQDTVAYIEYTKKFKELDNDLFKLAISHFYPLANTDPSKLDVIIGNNVITPRQYAEKLIKNMGSDIGSNIPLYYTQAPDFALWLERAGGEAPEVNTATGGGVGCGDLATASAVVVIAEREFASGANESDGTHTKYGGGQNEPWCGYFMSWVFAEAGKPFEVNPLPSVAGILAYAQEHGIFHSRDDTDFTPQPGDVVIYKEGLSPFPSHANIVISYDPGTNRFTSIGGNESNRIRKQTFDADLSAITGYMRVP